MEKILVTTDQSTNSKAAIRIAIKQAKQRKAELVILHVYHLLKPFKWTEEAFKKYTADFQKKTIEEISSFINGIFHSMDEPLMDYQLALVSNIDVINGVLDYAVKHNCSFICISTRGAGTLKKLFGTHTSKLISSSPIPVLSVPSNYRAKELKHILYASDMTDYERELDKVIAFARPVGAEVEIMHISYPYEYVIDQELIKSSLEKSFSYSVGVLNRKRDISNTMLEDIDKALKVKKPSLLVLFTHQWTSILEKILLPSNATRYSFYGKIPLLTFSKLNV